MGSIETGIIFAIFSPELGTVKFEGVHNDRRFPFNIGTQGRRNVTQSEEVSETSISSRVKTNLSTMDF